MGQNTSTFVVTYHHWMATKSCIPLRNCFATEQIGEFHR